MGPIAQFKLSFGGATSQDYDYAFAGRLGLLGYKLYKVILNNKLKIQI
jgi:hypothetical protein